MKMLMQRKGSGKNNVMINLWEGHGIQGDERLNFTLYIPLVFDIF